jgi:hypothetical protein
LRRRTLSDGILSYKTKALTISGEGLLFTEH